MYNKDTKILLINETFIVNHDSHNEWLDWFKTRYFAAIKDSQHTEDLILSKIEDNNPDGKTYALQFKINDIHFDAFQNEEKLIDLRTVLNKKFNDKFASFVTVLEIVED